MPLYDYRCKDCGHEMEVLQKIQDLAPPCEACHQNSLERCVTSAQMRFKGNGYYETDEKPQDKRRYISSSESCTTSKGSCHQGRCKNTSDS